MTATSAQILMRMRSQEAQERISGENERYLRWLEDRWDVHKHDHFYNNAEREEKRTEEVLEMFKELGELSKREVDLPKPPRWRESPW